ncbi:MAG: phosphatase PAP2 family protein [Acidobacteriota bacterium]|nr:phosphatase PAP2 family protein [Acidobacteriota bacterium]
MLDWTDLVLAYTGYLTTVAWMVPRFARARLPATMGFLAAAAGWWLWSSMAGRDDLTALVAHVFVPSLALLAAYQVSGAFFLAPNRPLERGLLHVDETTLHRTGLLHAYRRAPTAVRELFELMYLLVYVMLPIGATVLVLGGQGARLGHYWTVVFAAELACYGMLPWLQTRPPRALEDEPMPRERSGPLRRLSLAVLARGSIQVNTIPSGHAAGAVAIAFAVGSAMPVAGAAFLVLATGITLATVLGRYHYLADSLLGVAVAIAAWAALGG